MSTLTLKRLPSADWLAFGVALAFGVTAGTNTDRWSFASSFLQNGIVFGITAIALFRENPNGEPA